MTTETPVQIFNRLYEEWKNNSNRINNGHDYEQTYVAMMEKVGQEVLQSSVGEFSENKNLKKSPDQFWKNRDEKRPSTRPEFLLL